MAVKQIFLDLPKILQNGFNMLMFPLNTYPFKSSYRNAIYLVEGILIAIGAYLWLEYTQMDGMFKSVYPLIIAIIVISTQYLILETGGRYLYKRKGPFVIRMATFWFISFVAVFFGFIMVYFNAQCVGVEKIYPDIFYFYSDYPFPRPSRIAVFYKIILIPWFISMALLTQSEAKKRLDRELESIKKLNEELKKRAEKPDEQHMGIDSDQTIEQVRDRDQDQHQNSFYITSTDGDKYVAFTDICYISVADHYCELVIKKENDFYRELIRLSLKEVLANLPATYFEQVHRSHVVNLNYVKKIVRSGQAYKLKMAGTEELIPASRHRVCEFLPQIKKILEN